METVEGDISYQSGTGIMQNIETGDYPSMDDLDKLFGQYLNDNTNIILLGAFANVCVSRAAGQMAAFAARKKGRKTINLVFIENSLCLQGIGTEFTLDKYDKKYLEKMLADSQLMETLKRFGVKAKINISSKTVHEEEGAEIEINVELRNRCSS